MTKRLELGEFAKLKDIKSLLDPMLKDLWLEEIIIYDVGVQPPVLEKVVEYIEDHDVRTRVII